MYVGAGACPFPGQLQYRVVNPHGAGVFFEKTFATSVGASLRPGTIVCGTPRNDPSGMSAYVVELANGFANALDFEQITSAAPGPVLASGDFVGAACGPNLYWDEASQSCVPLSLPHVPTSPTPQCPPGSFYDYLKGTCVSSHVQTSGYYVGDGGPTIVPVLPCPPGQFWDEAHNHCVPNIPPPPPPGTLPPITPVAMGEFYVGDDAPIVPVLPCPPGQFWDPSQNHCVPNIPPPPPPVFPATLDAWRAQHRTGHYSEFVGAVAAPAPAPVHAANAASQASSAQEVATHPSTQQNPLVQKAAQKSAFHATQAANHAQAAQTHPTPHGAAMHTRAAAAHNVAAAHHARTAHSEAHGRRGGRGREGEFGRGREGEFGRGFGRGRGFGFGFGRGLGRGWGHFEPGWRFGHGWGWEHGGRYESWFGGVRPEWFRHRVRCAMRSEMGLCLKEIVMWPEGQVTYRLTPQGEAEQIALEVDEIAVNDAVQQQTGMVVPDASSGPLPGSDIQTVDDGDDADQTSADADQTSADAAGSDAVDAGGDAGAATVSGDFTGWEFPFTTPYPGYWNPHMLAAWDSSFEYPFMTPYPRRFG